MDAPQQLDDGVRLCLTGDVMTGRGVDQILGHPGDPTLHEHWLRSAIDYVRLAEQRSGPLPRAVDAAYIWGDVLPVLRRKDLDAFVVNLETAVTDRGVPWPGKGIHYRMHPANIGVAQAADIDVAVLANNHVLDWQVAGLEQTLDVLHAVGVATAGAGNDAGQAWRPAAVSISGGRRVVVVAVGSTSSGIPHTWAAGEHEPGLALLPDLSDHSIDRVAQVVRSTAGPGDVVVVSIHWGPNWGYEVPTAHRDFAHALIERAGVHVVHGHSSHHPLGVEVHRGHLVLYGCGDLLTDYEGIGGHERYRGELGALYLPTLDPDTGRLNRLDLVPTEVKAFRLTRPAHKDVEWLASVLDREGSRLGTSVTVGDDGWLHLGW